MSYSSAKTGGSTFEPGNPSSSPAPVTYSPPDDDGGNVIEIVPHISLDWEPAYAEVVYDLGLRQL